MYTIKVICGCGCKKVFPVVDTIEGPQVQGVNLTPSPFLFDDLALVFSGVADWEKNGGKVEALHLNEV
jgi:hypothetical protein